MNIPVWLLLVAPAVVFIGGRHTVTNLIGEKAFNLMVGALFVLCFSGAWLWWSIHVPKWRLWAYERVDNIPELKRKAIAAGLIWPDGSVFSRTEINSAAHAARERALEQGAAHESGT